MKALHVIAVAAMAFALVPFAINSNHEGHVYAFSPTCTYGNFRLQVFRRQHQSTIAGRMKEEEDIDNIDITTIEHAPPGAVIAPPGGVISPLQGVISHDQTL